MREAVLANVAGPPVRHLPLLAPGFRNQTYCGASTRALLHGKQADKAGLSQPVSA